MAVRWKITYTLVDPLVTDGKPSGYTSLGVAFTYDESGKLAKVEHVLDLSGGETQPVAVKAESRKRLTLMWDAFSFRVGIPINPSVQAEEIPTTCDTGTGLAFGASLDFMCDAVFVSPLRMPDEAALANVQDRRGVWLHFANYARDTRSEADALRTYRMILEERYPRASETSEMKNVRLARDFVSHASLNGSDVTQFLMAEFGHPVTKFDPRDPEHLKVVRKWRDIACRLVHNELGTLL